jgi:hypothetical protein
MTLGNPFGDPFGEAPTGGKADAKDIMAPRQRHKARAATSHAISGCGVPNFR